MMKKILVCILLCLLTSCTSKEEQIVCSTITHDESVLVDVVYTYDGNREVTKIENIVSVIFKEEDLVEKSLQEHYEEIKKENDILVDGVTFKVEMVGETALTSTTTIDLTLYDFEMDPLEIGNKYEYEDIGELIDEISSLGYYRCK